MLRNTILKRNLFKNYSLSQKLYSNSKFNFSQELKMPIIDLDKFIHREHGWEKECKILAECLHDTGILVVKDKVNNLK